jgi:HK97 family phage prohead protease
MELLKKQYSKGAVKDVSGRTVTGYYASWGALADDPAPDSMWIDSDGDVFDPTAFNKTIAQNGPEGANRIWHLFNHSFGAPINKPKVLKADNFGVYFETVFPETTLGNDTLKLYEAGAITEHSVMFNIIQSRTNERSMQGEEYQLIQEVRMWEGSSVLWGANSNTPTTGIKSEQAEAQIKLLDSLMHNGTFSDETFLMIEKSLQDIKAIYKGTNDLHPEPKHTEPAKPTDAELIKSFYLKLI